VSDSVKAFNGIAESYEDWYKQLRGAQVLQSELLGLETLLPASGTGFEVGAGTGIFAQQLTSSDRVVLCLDQSPRMLKRSRAKGLDAVLAAAEWFPLRRGSLDFVFMVTTIEFLNDPVAALRSIGSSLKKESPIVVLAINRDSKWGELYVRLGISGDHIFRHARIYSIGELESMLAEAGFVVSDEVGTLAKGSDEPEEPNLLESGEGAGAVLFRAFRKG